MSDVRIFMTCTHVLALDADDEARLERDHPADSKGVIASLVREATHRFGGHRSAAAQRDCDIRQRDEIETGRTTAKSRLDLLDEEALLFAEHCLRRGHPGRGRHRGHHRHFRCEHRRPFALRCKKEKLTPEEIKQRLADARRREQEAARRELAERCKRRLEARRQAELERLADRRHQEMIEKCEQRERRKKLDLQKAALRKKLVEENLRKKHLAASVAAHDAAAHEAVTRLGGLRTTLSRQGEKQQNATVHGLEDAVRHLRMRPAQGSACWSSLRSALLKERYRSPVELDVPSEWTAPPTPDKTP